jgi:signal transduction histidine kinase
MLEIRLRQAGLLESESAHPDIGRYLNILQDECDREIKLINNMLDLSRLDAQVEPTTLNTIRLQDWIPHLLEPFTARMEKQQQRLQIDVPQDLPAIKSDLFNLGRILTELLNNACKYTPAGETIRVAAQIMANEQSPYLPVVPPALEPMTTLHIGNGGSVVQQSNPDVPPPLPTPRSTGRVVDLFNRSHKTTKSTSTPPSSLFVISISNSGVEIPVAEQRRIFEKFYRIPTVDFWKHGGTGLGLALVQRLAMHLGGEISVNSAQQWTTFALRIPKRG